MAIKIPGVQLLRKRSDRETRYRDRPKESFRLLLSWTIYGKFLLSKLLKVGWWPCLVFPRVENWYWDVRAIGETRWNFLESDTRNSTWFLSRGNSSWWNRAIRCEWGNASWQTGETRYGFSRRSMASTIRHWKRWSRIGIVSRIKIIRESGEWSGAKKTETNFKCCRRWRKHSMICGLFMTVTMEPPVFMGKNYLNNCQSIVNTTDLTLKHMFDISTKLVSEQDEISGLETIGWETLMEIPVINWWRKKLQSSTHEGLRLFGFCVVPWEDFRKLPIERCMGTKIWMVKIFFLWQNRRRANGIRVEYFPRIQYVAAQWRSQTFTVQVRWETGEFHRKNHIYVDVQWHFLWNKRQRKKNVWQMLWSSLSMRRSLV